MTDLAPSQFSPTLHHFTADRDVPLGTILLAHGYAEHQGRYTHVVSALNAGGWDVITYDHFGHGTSPGRRACVDVAELVRTHIAVRHRAQEIVRPSRAAQQTAAAASATATPDAPAATPATTTADTVTATTPDAPAAKTTATGDTQTATANASFVEPLVLVGHSMGGIITARSAELEPEGIRAVVLSGPAFRPLPKVPVTFAKSLLPLARKFPSVETASLEATAVSHDEAIVEDYNNDPLNYRGKVPLISAISMVVEGDRAITDAGKITAPVLVLHGGADALASTEGSLAFANTMRRTHPDVIVRILPDLYHEIFNEPCRDEIFADMLDYLAKKA